MFLGQATVTCDEKWRVPVPADLRDAVPREVYLTSGIERCIWLLPEEKFKALSAALDGEDTLLDPQAHRLQRHFLGSSYPTKIDGQNRIRIPDALREYIGLTESDRQVTFVSAGRRVELWNAETYRAYREQELTRDNIIDDVHRLGYARGVSSPPTLI